MGGQKLDLRPLACMSLQKLRLTLSSSYKKLCYRKEDSASVVHRCIYRTVKKAFRYVEPFGRGSRCDRRTDGQTAVSNSALI